VCVCVCVCVCVILCVLRIRLTDWLKCYSVYTKTCECGRTCMGRGGWWGQIAWQPHRIPHSHATVHPVDFDRWTQQWAPAGPPVHLPSGALHRYTETARLHRQPPAPWSCAQRLYSSRYMRLGAGAGRGTSVRTSHLLKQRRTHAPRPQP